MRIISLLPSATEIVAALGHESELVGRSEECDFPPSVRDRTVIMRPRVDDFGAPSAAIDDRVRTARGQGESLYRLDVEALSRLRPDLLLTQDLCGVCSVTGAEVEAACQAAGVRPRILSLTPRTLADVWRSISTVAEALGDPRSGAALATRLEQRTGTRVGTAPRPGVAVVEWLDPPIVAGLWAADMIAAAGGDSLGPPSGSPGVRTAWTDIAARTPDLLLLSPCSFSVDRTRQEIDRSGLDTALSTIHPSRGIWIVDEAYFSRPGPRLADGVELVRAKLHGEAYAAPMPVRRWDGRGG